MKSKKRIREFLEKFGLKDTFIENTRELPVPLASVQNKQWIFAIALAIVTIIIVIWTRELAALSLLLISFYLIIMSLGMKSSYNRGKIAEVDVACVQAVKMSKTVQIICKDNAGNEYVFMIPNKKTNITVGYTYRIWFRESRKDAILAYQFI